MTRSRISLGRRLAAVGVAGAMAATIAGVASGSTAATPARQAATAHAAKPKPPSKTPLNPSYTPPKITWKKCTTGYLASVKAARCGMLTVPMDYSKPSGTKIHLAVSRILHTTKKSQGPMFTNPGGPGGSGLVYSVLQGSVPNGVGDEFDWYGMDPRGVGSSRPALTCNGNYFGFDRPSYDPTTSAAQKAWRKKALGYEKDCASQPHAALLQHMHTTDNVADFESLRKAIGASKVSFYGFSYGTYIAQVYATEYPSRIKRMVMDGVLDASRAFYYANLDQDKAFEKTINIFLGWVARHDSVYHLGTTQKVLRAKFNAEDKALRAHPAGGKLGSSEFEDSVLSAGYYVYGWEDTASALAALINKGNYKPLAKAYRSSNPVGKGADNGYAVYLATQCTDAPWPRDFSQWKKDNTRVAKQAPFYTWGNAWFNMPCKDWSVLPIKRVDVSGKKLGVHILLINETFDAATPYPGALATRKKFPTAALIEGVDGSTHAGSLSGVSCTDDTIAKYLATGHVPKRKAGNVSDKKCPPVPQPDPSASSSSRRTAVSPYAAILAGDLS